MSPLRPTTTSSSPSSAVAGVSPLALLVCILATIAAVPILLSASNESEAEEIAVVAVDETVTESALEAGVDMDQLFEAGARLESIPEIESDAVDQATTPTQPSASSAVPQGAAAGTSTLDAPTVAAELESSPAPTAAPPTTAAPTTESPATAPPTTAPPTTAAPTTAAPTTEPPTTAPPTTAAPTTAAPATEQAAPPEEPAAEDAPAGPEAQLAPTSEQWAALRQCESSGSYTVVSSNGLYHGAYQFYQPTWNGIARQLGRTDLVDVPPSQASAADQDAFALRLWEQRGPQPWPVCGRHLPPKP